MHSCLCLRSLLRIDENMLDMGSTCVSHVLLESEPDSYLSETLSAKVEPVLSNDGSILTASLAWTRSLAILSLLLRLYLGHGSQLAIVVP
jgi:hypothetical protein